MYIDLDLKRILKYLKTIGFASSKETNDKEFE